MGKRISEAQRLGFKQIIVPKVSLKKLREKNEITLRGVMSVNEAVDFLF